VLPESSGRPNAGKESVMTTTGGPTSPVARDLTAIDPLTTFPGRFAGRSLIITGGARGIGRAVALRAAREGARVVIADILEEQGRLTEEMITEAGGQAAFVATDVRSDADCQRMVETAVARFGSVDLALNAAGVMDGLPPDAGIDVASQRDLIFAPIHAASNAYWDQCFAVNVTGMFQSLRHELRQMLAQGNGGSVVNIGSIAALTGLGGNPAYTASKHAVTGLTRNAAIDYAPYGIRVNSVNMAATATPMTDSAFLKVKAIQTERALDPDAPQVPNASMIKTLSLLAFCDSHHRMSTPDEQAAVILFLLSADASNITGAAWATDGGWTTY
jgi:NAD(P)-dependent dehydrogenase (short-subunit alcohol dehydrogenase family)